MQLLLVVQELLTGLRREFEVRTLDNGIDRTSLLAVATVDAFGHVDVVARRTPASVFARFGLDSNRLRRAHGLAQFASDTALLTVGVPSQRVLPAKSGAEGTPSHTDS